MSKFRTLFFRPSVEKEKSKQTCIKILKIIIQSFLSSKTYTNKVTYNQDNRGPLRPSGMIKLYTKIYVTLASVFVLGVSRLVKITSIQFYIPVPMNIFNNDRTLFSIVLSNQVKSTLPQPTLYLQGT